MKQYNDREKYTNGHSYRDSARKRRNAEINKAYSHAEKARRGCEVTGLRCDAADLDWHHNDPNNKKFSIGHGYHRSFASFKAELKKCIAVHADIHMLLHRGDDFFL
jgi:hypothetical protein